MNFSRGFSMNSGLDLITFASWEERFLARFVANLHDRRVTSSVIYYLAEFANWSQANREKARRSGDENGVQVSEISLRVAQPADNWRKLLADIPERIPQGGKVLVDLTTMPREFIWIVFWFLEFVHADVEFVYSSPKEYNKDWLSRDPQRPRLLYKMSGIAHAEKRVCLIVMAGYDVDRTQQLINFYEPAVTFLGLQRGEVGSVNNVKMDENRRRFSGEPDTCCFSVDAYSDDQGEADILAQVSSYFDSHNVIMSSLGPKLSAVAMYRIQKRYPQAALAYAPSREFNREYSTGVGSSYWGRLQKPGSLAEKAKG